MKYYGDRSKESLKNFAMQYVTSTVTELWAGNVHVLPGGLAVVEIVFTI